MDFLINYYKSSNINLKERILQLNIDMKNMKINLGKKIIRTEKKTMKLMN